MKMDPLISNRCSAFGLIAAAVLGFAPAFAAVPEVTEPPFFSGQVAFGQATVEPAVDDVTGNISVLADTEWRTLAVRRKSGGAGELLSGHVSHRFGYLGH